MDTRYPLLRRALHPTLLDASDAVIEQIVADTHGAVTADELESFWKSLSKIGKAAAPIVAQAGQIATKALPGAIQGATAGAALGPYGMLAGGLIGGVGSALASPGPTTPAAGQQPAPRPGAPPQAIPTAAPAAPAAQQRIASHPAAHRPVAAPQPAGAAVQQLLALLADPTVQRALLAASLGRNGRETVPTVHGEVPVDRVTSAVAELAEDVADVVGGVAPSPISTRPRIPVPKIGRRPRVPDGVHPLDIFDMEADELDLFLDVGARA